MNQDRLGKDFEDRIIDLTKKHETLLDRLAQQEKQQQEKRNNSPFRGFTPNIVRFIALLAILYGIVLYWDSLGLL